MNEIQQLEAAFSAENGLNFNTGRLFCRNKSAMNVAVAATKQNVTPPKSASRAIGVTKVGKARAKVLVH